MKEHIQQKIISLCGSQSELARRLGKNSQTVSVWFRTQVPGGTARRNSRRNPPVHG